ncbi:TetR/AcrR family transcriptional regulator [Nocardioides sp.]|uniref:TetR/AcrR family transcriptional regulator n=1 Tax=Nocardioides sp. TaxID=35761 RepID=UPI003515D206
MTTSPRAYGGVPGDERRTQRRERLLEAVLDVVGEGGLAAVTVASVSTRAGIGKRYFYESFESTDALVGAALERIFVRVGEAIAASDPPDDSPAHLLEVAARSALDAMDDARVARFYLEASSSQAGLAAREAGTDLLTEHLLVRLVGPEQSTEATRLLGSLLVAGTHHVVATWLRGESGVTREELVELVVGIGVDATARMRRAARPR